MTLANVWHYYCIIQPVIAQYIAVSFIKGYFVTLWKLHVYKGIGCICHTIRIRPLFINPYKLTNKRKRGSWMASPDNCQLACLRWFPGDLTRNQGFSLWLGKAFRFQSSCKPVHPWECIYHLLHDPWWGHFKPEWKLAQDFWKRPQPCNAPERPGGKVSNYIIIRIKPEKVGTDPPCLNCCASLVPNVNENHTMTGLGCIHLGMLLDKIRITHVWGWRVQYIVFHGFVDRSLELPPCFHVLMPGIACREHAPPATGTGCWTWSM